MPFKKLRLFLACSIVIMTSLFAFQNCAPMNSFEAAETDLLSEDFFSLAKTDDVESSYISEGFLKLNQGAVTTVGTGQTKDLQILRTIAAGLNNNINYGLIDLGTATYDGLSLKECSSTETRANDNKAFLEKALASAGRKYVTLLIPKGTFCFSKINIQNVTGVTIQGMGSATGGTVLRLLQNQTTLFSVTSTNPNTNAANYLSFADFRITMADPKSSVVAFDVNGTVNGLSIRRVVAHNIGRFAKLYGKMLNLAFEDILIRGAHSPVFFFDGPYREGGKDKWGPQPISFFSVTGLDFVGAGAWIRFAGAASINLHNVDLTGGTHAIHSMKATDTNPRYITGQGLRFHSQTGTALKFENGLGIQLDDVTIDGCKEYGVYVGGVFDRGAQFSDFKIKGCSKYGFRLNNVDFISIVNPKIELNSSGIAAVRLEGQVRESVLHGGHFSGAKISVQRACKVQKCPSFIAKGVGTSPSLWKPGTFAYTPTMLAIQERRRMLIANTNWKAINGGNESSLQNAINELCATGGTILIGRAGVKLADRVNLPSQCSPIEIRGTSREEQSKIVIETASAGLDISGRGHNLRELNFTGSEELNSRRPLVITDAEDILMDSNTFKNFAEGVRAQRSKNLYFNYNRYVNIRGFAGLLLNSPEDGGVRDVKMLLETSKCVYSSETDADGVAVGAITDAGCAESTAFAIRGGVTNLVSIQSAYITGGTSLDIASSGSVHPGTLRFFQMGSDNPLNYSLKAANVRVLQVDGAWLGQAPTAVKLSGGTSTDKITFRLVSIQGLKDTLHSLDSNANIASLGGWYRISEPKTGSSTRLVSALFEPRSWVTSNSKTELALARNSLDTTEDVGEDDSYVPSNDELLGTLTKSFVSVFGLAPSPAESALLQGIISSGFAPDEFASVLQESSAFVKSQFFSKWNRSPANAELAMLTMAWLFSDGGSDLDERILSLARTCGFNGQSVAHGTSMNAFFTSQVVAGGTCQSQVRSCNDGTLSGSYAFASCEVTQVAAKKSCAFNGVNVDHGKSITSFANSTVAFGRSCQSETRTCNDGTLSGSFGHSFCNVQAAAGCNFQGVSVSHGDSVLAYANSRVSFGNSCRSERRTCNNGTLSGTFGHSFCNVQAAASCNFQGVSVSHGDSVLAYANSRVSFGDSCRSERRTCNNGSLSGSLPHTFCNADAPADCTFASGIKVGHGQSVLAYKTVKAVSGKCAVERRSCTNGSLSGSYGHSFCR